MSLNKKLMEGFRTPPIYEMDPLKGTWDEEAQELASLARLTGPDLRSPGHYPLTEIPGLSSIRALNSVYPVWAGYPVPEGAGKSPPIAPPRP